MTDHAQTLRAETLLRRMSAWASLTVDLRHACVSGADALVLITALQASTDSDADDAPEQQRAAFETILAFRATRED